MFFIFVLLIIRFFLSLVYRRFAEPGRRLSDPVLAQRLPSLLYRKKLRETLQRLSKKVRRA
jgi:hypothetical protein